MKDVNKEGAIGTGDSFKLNCGNTAKVTEVFSNGFNYHTLDGNYNCVKSQQYCLKSDAKYLMASDINN